MNRQWTPERVITQGQMDYLKSGFGKTGLAV